MRKGRKPVFGRLALALRPLDQQPFFRSRLRAPFVAMGRANPQARKARAQRLGRALTPFDRSPRPLRQTERKRLDRDRPMLVVAPHQLRSSSATRPGLCRQRPGAGRPHRGRRQNAGRVGQAQRRDVSAQIAVVAIAGVQQHYAARQAGRIGPAQLIERDLRLGLEHDLLRNPRLALACAVARPFLRQIQPVGDRQARMAIGQRQRHRHLAVVLLAELTAILPRHADRMPPLLGKARVVNDPRRNRAVPLDLRQHHLAHLGQYPLVGPTAQTDEMQQRLMLGRHPRRRRHRRQRFHALAFTRHHQAHAIVSQWTRSILVADYTHKPLDIIVKPRSTVISQVHLSPHAGRESPPLFDSPAHRPRLYDSVKLRARSGIIASGPRLLG